MFTKQILHLKTALKNGKSHYNMIDNKVTVQIFVYLVKGQKTSKFVHFHIIDM